VKELGNLCGVDSLILTVSFHSITYFSIHGTKFMVTNSRANLAVCWMSCSDILRVFNGTVCEVFNSGRTASAEPLIIVGGGNRGTSAGIDTGGGGGDGSSRERR
jgi:hypothetical protein